MKRQGPILPGSDGPVDSEEKAQNRQDLGFPVIIKAVAGGGGRGMRVIRRRASSESAQDGTRSRALWRRRISKSTENPSHRVQILGTITAT
jgi:biotin carboxylase